nr:hypothetical protein [Paracoccus lutimaris]
MDGIKAVAPIFIAKTRSFWLGIVPASLTLIDVAFQALTPGLRHGAPHRREVNEVLVCGLGLDLAGSNALHPFGPEREHVVGCHIRELLVANRLDKIRRGFQARGAVPPELVLALANDTITGNLVKLLKGLGNSHGWRRNEPERRFCFLHIQPATLIHDGFDPLQDIFKRQSSDIRRVEIAIAAPLRQAARRFHPHITICIMPVYLGFPSFDHLCPDFGGLAPRHIETVRRKRNVNQFFRLD